MNLASPQWGFEWAAGFVRVGIGLVRVGADFVRVGSGFIEYWGYSLGP
jgi:hypothetical protein